MPRECAVGGCCNRPKDGVSLHAFPVDEKIRKLWEKAVHSTRKYWAGPSKHTVVCSEHFEDECFDPSYQLKISMGMTSKRSLIKGAVPTKFPRVQPSQSTNVYKKEYQPRSLDTPARKARERQRVKIFIVNSLRVTWEVVAQCIRGFPHPPTHTQHCIMSFLIN